MAAGPDGLAGADRLERAFREEWAAVVATLARRLGDLDAAQDAAAEAFAAASVNWARDGVPPNPGGWLTVTAWRKAVDAHRSGGGRSTSVDPQLLAEVAAGLPTAPDIGEADMTQTLGDDRLGLVFACCHPALAVEARVALTLRFVAGLTTREIATAFLVPEATLAQRLVRAKRKIRETGIRFTVPASPAHLAERLRSVRTVVYLVFNEGFASSSGAALTRDDLCDEAIWLGRLLRRLMPDDAETAGLLALMLLHGSRRHARLAADGRPVPLAEQDRLTWDGALIAEGTAVLDEALALHSPGSYQMQAAIAALHAAAASFDDTDWPQIALLYGSLSRLDPSPVIEVNRAVAVGMADGPLAGLAVLAPVLESGALADYGPLHAAHGFLLDKAGDPERSRGAWARAAAAAGNVAVRDELLRRHVDPLSPLAPVVLAEKNARPVCRERGHRSVGRVSRPVGRRPRRGATGRATEADVGSTSNAAGAHPVSASGSGKDLGSRTVSPGMVLALTSIAFFMVSLDALVVVTALPAIHRSIGGSIGTLEWAVNAYALTFAAGIITAASLGERLGRRRVYATGLVVFTLASAACAVAPNASLLIAARAVQGLGAAAVTPLALTILAAAFPVERRGAVVGIFGGISGLAVAGGPLVGGAVTQGLDWHWIFWINVPFGVAAVVGSLLFLPAGRAAVSSGSGSGSGQARLDVPGAVLSAGGGALLAWGLVRVGGSGWSDPLGLAGVLGGLAVLVGFVAWERRSPSPMMPLRLFRVRAFAAANVTGFLSFGAIMSAAFLTAQYFQLGLGYSPLTAGLRMLPWTATPMIVAPLAGALADRIGTRPLLTVGLTMQAGGLAWVALLASAGASGYGRYVVPFIVAGVGISMAIPTVPTAALSAVSPADVGQASGVNNTMQRFGGAFGIALVSAVFAGSGHLGTAASFTAGYRPAMLGAAALSLLGALAAVAIGRRRVNIRAVSDETAAGTPGASASLGTSRAPGAHVAFGADAAGDAGSLTGADV